ncbi:DUF2170 domain-containing protein [Photobacterium kishitanii]|nr:cytoplasmic protein [Photobacterium kishitanii]OBU26051.1 cytoplasmic protein [Photobacterium kishitanii]PSV06702.1 DUF2170 domain-containing protein [Photobacterium kishitanii]PSV77551.1 DUF2170 domain-containing protein [Photobacterium kishitanii]PSW50112.1 DUF2170 domain-containing protein [Photobacterium kishitanii]
MNMWTVDQLVEILSKNDQWKIEQTDQTIIIRNQDGVSAYVALAGEQILVEAPLFPMAMVTDVAKLNDTILRTHEMFPLTNISIHTVDGDDYYIAFGSLSSQSKQESILIEVTTLFVNVEGFLEMYQPLLTEA